MARHQRMVWKNQQIWLKNGAQPANEEERSFIRRWKNGGNPAHVRGAETPASNKEKSHLLNRSTNRAHEPRVIRFSAGVQAAATARCVACAGR